MGAYASLIKVAIIAAILVAAWLALDSVTSIRADMAIAQQNAKRLEDGIKDQKAAMEQMQTENKLIRDMNASLNTQIQLQNRDVQNLQDKFKTDAKGSQRNFGEVAAKNPAGIERAVNRGTQNATRCLEIASGSPLTEKERTATLKSEINTECPSLANPKYVPK